MEYWSYATQLIISPHYMFDGPQQSVRRGCLHVPVLRDARWTHRLAHAGPLEDRLVVLEADLASADAKG